MDPVARRAMLTIDDREYFLVYDFNAIAEAEWLVNAKRGPSEERCNLLRASFAVMMTAVDARELRGLFYAALRGLHPKITMLEVSALCRPDTIASIHEALQRAWSLSQPESKREGPMAADGEPSAPAAAN